MYLTTFPPLDKSSHKRNLIDGLWVKGRKVRLLFIKSENQPGKDIQCLSMYVVYFWGLYRFWLNPLMKWKPWLQTKIFPFESTFRRFPNRVSITKPLRGEKKRKGGGVDKLITHDINSELKDAHIFRLLYGFITWSMKCLPITIS